MSSPAQSDGNLEHARAQLAKARRHTDTAVKNYALGSQVALARVVVAAVRELMLDLRLLTLEERARDEPEAPLAAEEPPP